MCFRLGAGQLEVVKYLIENKINREDVLDNERCNILMAACRGGHLPTVR